MSVCQREQTDWDDMWAESLKIHNREDSMPEFETTSMSLTK